ncbi:ATP-binding cassette domain-containing protein [Leifsonia shinshuensis]|uniref:Simple sugar transport system ATP-binding protein n=1 Tax=Leifsonia shinshuensis TaxID=150026 RepID=A0A853CZJ9_9MICO|nr:simple sugar transport system ATP-binding protein [Leifsonia shinshuensis]
MRDDSLPDAGNRPRSGADDSVANGNTALATPGVAIAARNVSKQFGHVHALRDASLTAHHGEIVALFGDNGAGKSTFLRILQGSHKPDNGEVIVDDQPVVMTSVRDAQRLGVDTVYQDLSLAPDLSVVDNMFLGDEILTGGAGGLLGILDRKEMEERTDAALRELSIALPSLTVPIRDLSGGQRQAVAVARSVMRSTTAVLLDEPTAALGARQSELVCDLMRRVADRGLGVVVVSHDLPRVLGLADRVVILWRGETVLDSPAADLTVPEVVATMVGYKKEQAS